MSLKEIVGESRTMNEFVVTINSNKYVVKFSPNGEVTVGENTIPFEVTKINGNAYLLKFGNRVFEITSNKISGNNFGLLIDGWYFDATVRTLLQETVNELQQNKAKAKHHSDVKAPMPGLILKMKKLVGESVNIGDPILILEAMKMENELRSPSSGTVKEIFYKEGQSVEKDVTIMTIE